MRAPLCCDAPAANFPSSNLAGSLAVFAESITVETYLRDQLRGHALTEQANQIQPATARNSQKMPRKKALIIGINYAGTEHALNGCINDAMNVRDFLVNDRGFPPHGEGEMTILTDDPENEGTELYPTHHNILAAFKWLVTDNGPGDVLWLSYSGHGGQVKDLEGERASGLDDTICPIDFAENGQITSDVLHRAIVSPMHPDARLTILFDCCHSGSACELPFVFRPDAEGNVNMLDTFKKGVGLVRAAGDLLGGGLSMDKVDDAKMLLGGATDFFHSLRYGRGADEEGLAKENFQENWESEGKDVWMFSGCRDDQTSADATIAGAATGAMSWAFMKTMRENPDQSYVNVLQNTRSALVENYSQVPQLSCGGRYDLDQQVLL
ncbi:peptidase C14, caspase domain-containing protein [Podospora aff. communis PSN243]|uniref:Peptidase C14, caspase domain-containing protein n=1 Tax=Podospora aff. communis PSN243 TaxID=3040156 RepID=A0AAV9GL73_9PEZI|nr:peptidase C14, caspase domain-containing protein [Podospora aff. communis PSN243]